MTLQFVPFAIVSATISMIMIVLAVAVWRRRPGAGVIPLVIMLVGITVWTFSEAAAFALVPLTAKKVAVIFDYVGITTIPAAWLAFVLEYTGRGRWLNRRTIPLFFIEPVLVQAAILTNAFHHLFWTDRWLDASGRYVLIDAAYGPLFWIHAVYSYALLLIGTILLIGAFIRSPQVYRGQMFWMLVAALIPTVSDVLYVLRLLPLPDYIDPTPLVFSISIIAISWSMFRHRFLDLIPVARDIVVEGISDAVIVLDRNNRIIDANPAALKLFGLPLKAVTGQLVESFLTNQPDLVEKYRTVEQAQAEIELKLDGGPPHTYAMRLSPLRSRRGDLVGRVVVLHDITDLKETNRELKIAREKAEESNRLKSQFLTTISHELRTPLHAIHGFTELILEGMTGEINALQRSNLERVLANADNLNQMIDDLLDLSKIEAGRIDVIRQPFEVKTWFDELVDQTKKLAEEKGLRYLTTLDNDLPDRIVGDPGRLRQIAANLISNAVKFTEKGEVQLTVRRESADLWRISVSDTGIGISPHAQEYIFDRFRQVDASPTRQYGGSGLGLAIVRDLAMMMGGGVRVRSEVGKGSTFTVTLPLIVPEAAPQP